MVAYSKRKQHIDRLVLPTDSHKSNDLLHNRVAAVKVIDVDTQDWKGNIVAKDDTVRETLHEISVLQQLQDAKAKNINPFFEAFQIHSQLWIVNEYCPGGSVRTLVSLLNLVFQDIGEALNALCSLFQARHLSETHPTNGNLFRLLMLLHFLLRFQDFK